MKSAADSSQVEPFGLEKIVSNAAAGLLYLPIEYQDCTKPITKISDLQAGKTEVVLLTLIGVTEGRVTSSGTAVFGVEFADAVGGRIVFSIFGTAYPWIVKKTGHSYLLRAKFHSDNFGTSLKAVEMIDSKWVGQIRPIYAGKKRVIATDDVAHLLSTRFEDMLQPSITELSTRTMQSSEQIQRVVGGDVARWLKSLHMPTSLPSAHKAQAQAKRLVALSLCAVKPMLNRQGRSYALPDSNATHNLAKRLPYKLTIDQSSAIELIFQNLNSSFASETFLVADVGCGKSAAFLLPMLAHAMAGAFCVVMVPRTILVQKTLDEIKCIAPDLNIADTEHMDLTTQVVVGTTGLLHRKLKRIDILVIDEQQKFSAEQRRKLITTDYTDVIEVSATPIPRSMAKLLCSPSASIVEMHDLPFPKRVTTQLATQATKRAMFDHLKDIVEHGGQIAIVYPRIGEPVKKNSDPSIPSDQNIEKTKLSPMAKHWENIFPNCVSVLHGQMSAESVRHELTRINSGIASVLISTTLIELGITLPNLKGMVIVEPEMHGLSQLHQLRGRLVRHGGEGFCYGYSPGELNDAQQERLRVFAQCNDGYSLALEELKLRGAGDVSGMNTQFGNTKTIFDGLHLNPVQAIAAIEWASKYTLHFERTAA